MYVTYQDLTQIYKQAYGFKTGVKTHDDVHTFIGGLANPLGEVLVATFQNPQWTYGNMSIEKATPLFRAVENYFITRSNKSSLKRLTTEEIEYYTHYLNYLVQVYEQQKGKPFDLMDLNNEEILQTPQEWLA